MSKNTGVTVDLETEPQSDLEIHDVNGLRVRGCPGMPLGTVMVTMEILQERRRQMAVEGWTPQHDDEHGNRELAEAARSYVEHYVGRQWLIHTYADGLQRYQADPSPDDWPWDERWWKPKDQRRDLVRAAALLIAEIERMDRAVK